MFQLKQFQKKKFQKYIFKIGLWYLVNNLIIYSFIPSTKIRIFLRLFGSKIGTNVTIHPYTNVKYPWKLKIGNNCGLGLESG